MVLHEISSLSEVVEKKGGISTLSFDIFDTLVSRSIDPPENIKRFVADTIVRELQLGISSDEFNALRKQVEREICDASQVQGGDGECCLTDVFSLLVQQLGLDVSYVDKFLACELLVEKTFSVVIPGTKEFLRQLASHYSLVAVSDTYLPAWMVKELLEHNGLACCFSAIYVSCEFGLSKASGRLFAKVLEQEGLVPGEVLHIGDNFLGDYFSPRNCGIRSVILRNRRNLRRKIRLAALGTMGHRSAHWRAKAFSRRMTADYAKDGDSETDQFYKWGRIVIGPILCNYIHLLCLELARSSHDVVFFVAREGYLLQRLYRLFSGVVSGSALPKPRYLCISRYTAFLASLHDGVGDREIAIALSEYRAKPEAVLARFGISDHHEVIRPLEISAEFNDDYLSKKDLAVLLRRILEEDAGRELIREQSNRMKAGLAAYLEKEGFFSSRSVALADVGWYGGIQDGLEKTFSARRDSPFIYGYYLALEKCGLYSTRNKKGLVHDFKDPSYDGTSLGFFKLAFEFSCRAPHGTTIGYEADGAGRSVPLFMRDSREKGSNSAIMAIQRGVLDCAQEYLEQLKVENVDPFLLRGVLLSCYDKQVSFPESAMARAFNHLVNTEDFGSDRIKRIADSFRLRDVLQPKNALTKLIETPWREAALVQFPLPGILSVFHGLKWLLVLRRIAGGMSESAGRIFPGITRFIFFRIRSCLKPEALGWYPTYLVYGILLIRGILGNWLTSILIRVLRLLPANFSVAIISKLIRIKASFLSV